ncbi:MAG: monovalent cation/H(+) antiporter subunit G [Candidatus Aenigmarchaeota archaeon]|nr:monovalent cation/H(+) antiporter subunit G [Candidatus Aenigmarchaeota archaeon]
MITDILLLISSISALLGAIGMLRFKDCYTRIHAATMISVGGVMLALIVIALDTFGTVYSAKAILITIFFALTNPVSSHAIVNAAHRTGIVPENLKKDDLR